jgi:hypothetical protein
MAPVRRALAPLAAVLLAAGAAAGDPAPKPAPTPVAAQPLEGPYRSIDGFCPGCQVERRLEGTPRPFREVRVVASGDPRARPTPSNQQQIWLAIRTDRGWWGLELGFRGVICGGDHESFVSLRVDGLDVDRRAGAPAPWLVVGTDGGVLGSPPDGRTVQVDDRRMILCAVGPGGRPSCATFHVRRRTGSAVTGWERSVRMPGDGTVILVDDLDRGERAYRPTFP